jgi:hypothetical protein
LCYQKAYLPDTGGALEIKRPELNVHLPDLSNETEQNKTASNQPVQSADTIETNKASNALNDAVAAAQQDDGNTGEKNLNDVQQGLISNFHPETEHLEDVSFFLKDARSSHEGQQNSDLHLPFGFHIQEGTDQAKMKENAEKAKNLLQDQNTVHNGSDKDFTDMAPGLHVNIRDQFDKAVGEKHSDLNDLGALTSLTDRLKSESDPGSKGPQGGGPTYGKGMFADSVNPSQQETQEYIKKYQKEHPNDQNTPPTTTTPTNTDPPPDNPVKKPSIKDIIINFIEGVGTPRGFVPPPVPPDKATGQNMIDGFKAIFDSKSRTPETVVKQDGKSLFGIPDPNNAQGNLPAALKKLEDFFKEQMKNMRPPSGGEKAHTVDEAGTQVKGPVDSLIVKQGNLGLLGNPGESPGGVHAGTYQGGSNPSVFGGNVDYGPNSDKTGWTGRTITDNEGDVKFGKEEAAVGMQNSGKSDSTDASQTVDLTRLRELIENLRKEDPASLSRLLDYLKKSE